MLKDNPEDLAKTSSDSDAPDNEHISLELLDGASPSSPLVAVELKNQEAIAADKSLSLDERMEAYEDIIDSEIGDTTMTRSRNIEREIGLRQIYLKFEGSSPTGTQKDRIAFAQAMDALRRGYEAMTVATCGNYGVAVALAAKMAGLRCKVFIPEGYHTKRIDEMHKLGAHIERVAGDYERSVIVSSQRAIVEEMYDANPGGINTNLQLKAYAEIATEIFDELHDAPAAVAVPVSNGTTLAGIHRGFLRLYRRGKTSRMPRIIAGSSHNKNPIIRAVRKNLNSCEDLEPTQIKETIVNEPLINWHAADGDLALDAIRATNGFASYASDKAMRANARMLRDRAGLNVLPASTAGLLVLMEQHAKQAFPGDRYVVILTGRK